MPDPKDFKTKDAFMSACVAEVKKEGKDQKAAVGQCLNKWRNRNKGKTKKSEGDPTLAGNILTPEVQDDLKED